MTTLEINGIAESLESCSDIEEYNIYLEQEYKLYKEGAYAEYDEERACLLPSDQDSTFFSDDNSEQTKDSEGEQTQVGETFKSRIERDLFPFTPSFIIYDILQMAIPAVISAVLSQVTLILNLIKVS